MVVRVRSGEVVDAGKSCVGDYFVDDDQKFISTGCTVLDCRLAGPRDPGGWALGRVSNVVGDMSCLPGDTIVSVLRGIRPKKMAIQTLYARAKGDHWNRNKKATTSLLADVGGFAGTVPMLDIFSSGVKTLYEVTDIDGRSIRASEQHQFLTDDGWKCLADLRLGMHVRKWRSTRERSDYREPYESPKRAVVYSIPYHPFGAKNIVAGRDYKRLFRSRLVVEAAMNGLGVAEFIRILRTDPIRAATLDYVDPELDVHHLNGDPLDDSLNNLQVIEPSDHKRLHADGFAPAVKSLDWVRIGSIIRRDKRTTFDITMAAPYHNFIADGFVVHNSGKTLLAIETCANFHRQFKDGHIWYREAEGAFDVPYAERVGLPADAVDFGPDGIDSLWDTIEDISEDMDACLDKAEKTGQPGLYIIDSLDAISSRAELARKPGEGTYSLEKQKQLGQLFRRMVRRLRAARVTLLVVSQIRENIGVIFGERHKRVGGKSLDFYASQILWLHHMKRLMTTVRGVERVTAVRIRAKSKKNKVGGDAFGECEFVLRFGYGVDDLEASLMWLKSVGMLDRAGIRDKSAKDQDAAIRNMLQSNARSDSGKAREQIERVAGIVRSAWAEVDDRFRPARRKYG